MNSSLLVLGRPRVSLSYGPIYAEKGSNVSLPLCHVTGHPPPKVTWLKAFSVLPSSRSVIGGNHLTLFSVKKQDSGLYVCKGYNLLGSALGKTQLIVVSLPKFTTTPPPSVTFVLGGTLRLDCQAIADPPAVISWVKRTNHYHLIDHRYMIMGVWPSQDSRNLILEITFVKQLVVECFMRGLLPRLSSKVNILVFTMNL